MHPTGRFLYGSNRGHDSISCLHHRPVDRPADVCRDCRHRRLDAARLWHRPHRRLLIAGNQRSDSVVVFRIDRDSGRLTPTGSRIDGRRPCQREVRQRPAERSSHDHFSQTIAAVAIVQSLGGHRRCRLTPGGDCAHHPSRVTSPLAFVCSGGVRALRRWRCSRWRSALAPTPPSSASSTARCWRRCRIRIPISW